MYIKLGTTNINYINNSSENFIILSQIVNSSLSYEHPILVQNTEQLNLWFGENFSDRDYLCELLNMGVSLYLYKPVSSDYLIDDNYIDLTNYDRVYISSDISSLEKIENTIFIINNNEEYIYLKEFDNFILVSELPQNQTINSTVSRNNRDTLLIGENNLFISPKYDSKLGFVKNSGSLDKSLLDCTRLGLGYQTVLTSKNLSFSLNFSDSFCSNLSTIEEEYPYLILGDTTYYCSINPIETFPNNTTTAYKKNILISGNTVIDRVNSFKNGLISFGYQFNNDILLVPKEDGISINKVIELFEYYSYYENYSYSHTLTGFSIDITDPKELNNYQNISSSIYSTVNDELISFYSKTIGTADQIDGDINVSIEEVRRGYYRVIISRFDYSEIFEGTIDGSPNFPKLDQNISTNSKLVYCNINVDRGYFKCVKDTDNKLSWISLGEGELTRDKIIKSYITYNIDEVSVNTKEGDIAMYRKSLPLGSWKLRGAVVEDQLPENYERSLDILRESSDNVPIDFLLIPNIERFGTELDENSQFYKIYKKIYNLSKEIDCQVLIHNTPCNIERDLNGNIELITGQSMYNYLNDKDNRLIYFYDSIWVYGVEKPGYYIYLNSLLLNDNYSPSVTKVLYNTPVKDSYMGYLTDIDSNESLIENWLINHKTNYLVTNNHIYYYKNYQNGLSFNMSGWMRFCISKINRELIKNKWKLLDNSSALKIESNIKNILSKITNSFSMIRNIQISEFLVDTFKNKSIEMTIETSVSDLYNNHLTIDITLNYNKKLN